MPHEGRRARRARQHGFAVSCAPPARLPTMPISAPRGRRTRLPGSRRAFPTLPSLTLAAAVALAAALPAQTSQQAAVLVTATPNASPPSLALSWPFDATATAYSILRRLPGATWSGIPVTVPGGGAATGWTDTNVTVGTRYEYWVAKAGSVPGKSFLTAGIEVGATEDRGIVVLLVDGTKVAALGSRLDRLVSDLVGDGWRVLRHDVPAGSTIQATKALITADVAAYPNQVKNVFLLGRLPVPYSGYIAPDGHSDHYGAWPADLWYGELNGTWTDTTINNSAASRPENRNVPGDGKFDQSTIASDVDLGVGRVDFANMPSFAAGETALLQQYLDKDHDYRHKVFAADARALIDDNFGYFSGEAFAASGWRAFAALVGPANIVQADYFGTLNTTSGGGYLWSYGCGGGSYQSAGGIGTTADFTTSTNRTVFTMLFGSYFGDWDSTDNFLRAPLCQGWTLANVWAGRPHWSFHPMALGETLGYCTKYSQNDSAAGGYGARNVHVALMGDPTLREHVIAPPTGLAIVDQWPAAALAWTPSADAVAGYHVYRSASPLGPFVRLTTAPVVGTAFVDPAALAGPSTYLVRAIRLESTPSGSYWNLSQGGFASASLPTLAAAHTTFGAGCYTVSDSFRAYFATAAAANAALQGRSLTLTPANGGTAVAAGGVGYLAPGAGAAVLPLGDDDAVAVPLPAPFAGPAGPVSTLYVHGNGIVALAPFSLAGPASAEPGPAALLAEPATAFYSWHDFDPTEPGSGAVKTELVGGTFCITWDDVESHPAGANRSTVQFQFELATGVVRLLWPAVAATGTGQTTSPSEPWLVGYSPGGPSPDGGDIDLATGLPLHLPAQPQWPLRLSASPAPVVTATAGATVVYTLDDMPEFAPGSRLGLLVAGLVPDVAGTSLAPFGMPGCAQHVSDSLVSIFAMGPGPSLGIPLVLPAGFPRGVTVYAQALALCPPNGLPNGQNPLGAVSSNGVSSFVNDH